VLRSNQVLLGHHTVTRKLSRNCLCAFFVRHFIEDVKEGALLVFNRSTSKVFVSTYKNTSIVYIK
jgi:hypothetical protein